MPDASLDWVRQLAGRFVVFDGPDGSGKSTQFRRFAELVERHGVEVCEVREPGGTHVGEQIRRLLLDPTTQEQLGVTCEMLLFMASRAQLVAQRVRPELARGRLVLADRFISSTLAYQGAAGGTPIDDILAVGRIALGETWPDLVVVFDVDEQTAASRLSPLLDRIEQRGAAYHRKVREGYLEQARREPGRYLVIDARDDADAVFARLVAAMPGKLAELDPPAAVRARAAADNAPVVDPGRDPSGSPTQRVSPPALEPPDDPAARRR